MFVYLINRCEFVSLNILLTRLTRLIVTLVAAISKRDERIDVQGARFKLAVCTPLST